ncbi:MAG: zinc-dependent metalloprotease, partial [Propionibacteriaceae bacterium]|nr:zinc-dependent metalloprotease [Propionibacteriaceae bacterium]
MSSVDWELAARTAKRLTKPGPQVPKREMAAAVSELHSAADRAIDLVVSTSGLPNDGRATVYVVDRPSIIGVNLENSAYLMQASGLDDLLPEPDAPSGALGVIFGSVMSYLAAGVLGQFVPFQHPALYLVAPNVMESERKLAVDPHDFRLWVCLHEQTHQAQFAAAPWLAERLLQLVSELALAEADEKERTETFLSVGQRMLEAGRKGLAESGLLDLVRASAPPEMTAALDTVTAQMSLLEGHADVIMDEVGPGVIPSLASIRAKFDKRRAERKKGWKALPAKITGMDAKMAQYANGARFCRAVLQAADMNTLNLAFAAPENVPTLAELSEPAAWITRVTANTPEARPLDGENETVIELT